VGVNDIDVRARDLFGNDRTEDVQITRVEVVPEVPPEVPPAVIIENATIVENMVIPPVEIEPTVVEVKPMPAPVDYAPYAIVIVIIALILAAIAIFRKK
jgi:hypothetical protein